MGKRIHWAFDGTLAYWGHSTLSTRQAIATDARDILDGDLSKTSYVLPPSDHPWLLVNFPSPVAIDKIGLRRSGTSPVVVRVSNDSTDGFDGTWTPVLEGAGYDVVGVYQLFFPTVQAASWLRIEASRVNNYNVHLFGEYVSPRFEYWNSSGTAELTDDYPLTMANAPNLDDYHGNTQFRLKNTDTSPHSYSLSVKSLRYGGDAIITNNYTLSVDGGSTKLATVAISNLAPGELSGVIDVFGDVIKANNPADGYHYFWVDVTETA